LANGFRRKEGLWIDYALLVLSTAIQSSTHIEPTFACSFGVWALVLPNICCALLVFTWKRRKKLKHKFAELHSKAGLLFLPAAKVLNPQSVLMYAE